jgi:hypothetical protein
MDFNSWLDDLTERVRAKQQKETAKIRTAEDIVWPPRVAVDKSAHFAESLTGYKFDAIIADEIEDHQFKSHPQSPETPQPSPSWDKEFQKWRDEFREFIDEFADEFKRRPLEIRAENLQSDSKHRANFEFIEARNPAGWVLAEETYQLADANLMEQTWRNIKLQREEEEARRDFEVLEDYQRWLNLERAYRESRTRR